MRRYNCVAAGVYRDDASINLGIVALYCLPEKVMVTLSPQIKGIHIGGLDRVGADTLALQEGHIEMAHFLIAHFFNAFMSIGQIPTLFIRLVRLLRFERLDKALYHT